jgi:6-phospho-3-hexuloisomerase
MRLSQWIHYDLEEVTAILAQTTDESAERLVTAVVAAPRIFVMALGRSGLILRMFAMRLMQIGLAVHVVGDVTTPAIAPGDLLIVLSGSGRTETVVALARKAGSLGARVVAITSGAETPLAALADEVIVLPAGSVKHDLATPTRLPLANALEQAIAIFLDCAGAMVAERCGQDNAAMMRRHANLE